MNSKLRGLTRKARVAIVGGSDVFCKARIDSGEFDFVVRVNNNFMRQGGRVDALYTRQDMPEGIGTEICFACADINSLSWERWVHYSVQLLFVLSAFDTSIYGKPNPNGPEMEWCNVFCRQLNTMPLTGIMAIREFSLLDVSHLFLTGFDFYSKEGVPPAKRDSHDIVPQVEWLRELVHCDTRIECDEVLADCLRGTFGGLIKIAVGKLED